MEHAKTGGALGAPPFSMIFIRMSCHRRDFRMNRGLLLDSLALLGLGGPARPGVLLEITKTGFLLSFCQDSGPRGAPRTQKSEEVQPHPLAVASRTACFASLAPFSAYQFQMLARRIHILGPRPN